MRRGAVRRSRRHQICPEVLPTRHQRLCARLCTWTKLQRALTPAASQVIRRKNGVSAYAFPERKRKKKGDDNDAGDATTSPMTKKQLTLI